MSSTTMQFLHFDSFYFYKKFSNKKWIHKGTTWKSIFYMHFSLFASCSIFIWTSSSSSLVAFVHICTCSIRGEKKLSSSSRKFIMLKRQIMVIVIRTVNECNFCALNRFGWVLQFVYEIFSSGGIVMKKIRYFGG